MCARVCARESRDELASPRQEKNRRKALRGAASGCGGETIRRSACSFLFFRTFLSLHGWRRRIFLSAWHTWHRKGTNSFVKTRGSPAEDEISAGQNTTVLQDCLSSLFMHLPTSVTTSVRQDGMPTCGKPNLCVALWHHSTFHHTRLPTPTTS